MKLSLILESVINTLGGRANGNTETDFRKGFRMGRRRAIVLALSQSAPLVTDGRIQFCLPGVKAFKARGISGAKALQPG